MSEASREAMNPVMKSWGLSLGISNKYLLAVLRMY
jgi:hypothetical protein